MSSYLMPSGLGQTDVGVGLYEQTDYANQFFNKLRESKLNNILD